jgi:hypothetical protein
VSGILPIEVDPDMPSREYIPLPGGWEIQTKGNGSSYRLLDRKTGQRHSILANEASFVKDFVTRMAKEVNASTVALVEALELAEELYRVGLLSAPDGLAQKVVEARRAALAAVREGQPK